MKVKQIQLARLYKRGVFMGYGVAVDNVLLSSQVSTNIESLAHDLPRVNVVFNIKAENVENPIQIDLDR